MVRFVPTAVVIALIASAGVLQGTWSGRWDSGSAAKEAAAQLDKLPAVVGDWVSESNTINAREQKIAQADGMISRRYVHRQTGAVVTVMLLCGRAGPISVHPPEVCFPGAGFKDTGNVSRFSPNPAVRDRFWVRQFEKGAPAAETFRLIYGWSDGNLWDAPDNPRLAYGGKPVLYKLYLVHGLQKSSDALESDPAVDLLRKLIPQLRTVMTPGTKPAT